MPLIDDKQKAELLQHFGRLEDEVGLLLFTRQTDCDYCKITTDLLTELAALSPKIKFRTLDLAADKVEAGQYGVDKAPAIVVKGKQDFGIRFFGVPAGHEFSTLVEDILMVSSGKHLLEPEVMQELDKVDQPVRIQVFISPSCPYCPAMVRVAHRFAMANKFITAEMVEVSEFAELALRYEVQGVPHTMIGEGYGIVGVFKEREFAQEVLRGIGKLPIELTEHAKIHGDEIAGSETKMHVHEHEHMHHQDHVHRVPGSVPRPVSEPGKKPAPKAPDPKPAPKTVAPKASARPAASTGLRAAKKSAPPRAGKKRGKK